MIGLGETLSQLIYIILKSLNIKAVCVFDFILKFLTFTMPNIIAVILTYFKILYVVLANVKAMLCE